MVLTYDQDMGAFSAEVNSVFSPAWSVVLFPGRIENTTFHHR